MLIRDLDHHQITVENFHLDMMEGGSITMDYNSFSGFAFLTTNFNVVSEGYSGSFVSSMFDGVTVITGPVKTSGFSLSITAFALG